LEMNPDNKLQYRFDDQWETLEHYDIKARIKILGFIKLSAKQKFYKSKYGVTFKTKQGVFALRFPANRDIRAAEQWYRMNKATDWESFREAISMRAIICTNIVYADREDHIYYLGNGRFPIRNPAYDWQGVLPGNTSATLWKDDYYPLDSLAQVLDPPCGYVYNCNHSPFLSSSPADNPNSELIPKSMGYRPAETLTNRGARFPELIAQYDRLDYEDFKQIKYDMHYTKPLHAFPRLEPIFHLDPNKYPHLQTSIILLNRWDRNATLESAAASTFILSLNYLLQHKDLRGDKSLRGGTDLDEAKLVEALAHTEAYLLEHFGNVAIKLGELQKHARGDVALPMSGGPDVMAAIYSRPQKDGTIRPYVGDSYVQLVRFSSDGPEIESIHAYGASAKSGKDHYTDQMPLFAKQQLKPMTLDRETIFREAKRIYHPRER